MAGLVIRAVRYHELLKVLQDSRDAGHVVDYACVFAREFRGQAVGEINGAWTRSLTLSSARGTLGAPEDSAQPPLRSRHGGSDHVGDK